MKVKNSEIVDFFQKGTDIVALKVPRRLYTAVSLNVAALQEAARVYEGQHKDILSEFAKKDDKGEFIIDKNSYVIKDTKGYGESMQDLLEVEVTAELQTVSEATLDLMEEKDKFDALTGQQLAAIEFMIEK